MKKLTYLFAAFGLFMFTACGGGATEEAATEEATEVAVCSNTGEPCLEDHSCCAVKEEATDSTGEEGHTHEHDHSDGESHDHEHDHSDGEGHDHEH